MEKAIMIFINYLRKWYCDEYDISEEDFIKDNNIDLLKFLKIIFFVSAARGENSYLLNNQFNNFYALPLGPVESEVYNIIKKQSIIRFENNSLKLCKENAYNNEIDENIAMDFDELKKINPELIKYSSRQLVNITHKWESWKSAYEKAQKANKKSGKMNTYLIMSDYKYFY